MTAHFVSIGSYVSKIIINYNCSGKCDTFESPMESHYHHIIKNIQCTIANSLSESIRDSITFLLSNYCEYIRFAHIWNKITNQVFDVHEITIILVKPFDLMHNAAV